MAGIPPADQSPATSAALFATRIAWACERAQGSGVKIVIKPINYCNMPGYFLHTTTQPSSRRSGATGLACNSTSIIARSARGRYSADGSADAGDRACAGRRRAAQARTRHRRDRLGVHVPADRRACSSRSTRLATRVGSAASTARLAAPSPALPGAAAWDLRAARETRLEIGKSLSFCKPDVNVQP